MINNKKFIEYFMSKFQVKTQEMCYFLNVTDKTVYNYRTLDYEDLPTKVKNHFFNFFMIGTFENIYEICSKMNSDQIIELSDRFFRFSNIRNSIKESGAFSNIINTPDNQICVTTSDDINKMDNFYEILDDLEIKEKQRKSSRSKYNNSNIATTITDNQANQTNPNVSVNKDNLITDNFDSYTIKIKNPNLSRLFLQVLEAELNRTLKTHDDYDFISYIKKYDDKK